MSEQEENSGEVSSSDFDSDASDSDDEVPEKRSKIQSVEEPERMDPLLRRPKIDENPMIPLPKPVQLKRYPTGCVAFGGLVLVSDHRGYVNIFKYVDEKLSDPICGKLHSSFCHVDIADGGNHCVSAGHGRSIVVSDISTSSIKPIIRIPAAHGSSISAVCWYKRNIIVTGDTRGRIKAFDIREPNVSAKNPLFKFYENKDYISDFTGDSSGKYLFATSGDGTMSTIDVRKTKFVMQTTEPAFSDMSSVTVMKDDSKVIAAVSDFGLFTYDMGYFGAPSDKYPFKMRQDVERIFPVTENTLIAGFDSGALQIVSTYPNRKLCKIGSHNLSVDGICLDVTGDTLITVGGDKKMKFWDVRRLYTSKISQHMKGSEIRSLKSRLSFIYDPKKRFFDAMRLKVAKEKVDNQQNVKRVKVPETKVIIEEI